MGRIRQVLAIGLPFILIGGLLGSILCYLLVYPTKPYESRQIYDHAYYPAHGEPWEDPGLAIGDKASWFGAISGAVLGIGAVSISFWLYLAAIAQMQILKTTNETAARQLAAAEQANFMRRSNLEVFELGFVPGFAKRPQWPLMHFGYKLHGETSAMVIGLRAKFYLHEGTPPTEIPIQDNAGTNTAARTRIPANGYVGTDAPTNFFPVLIDKELTVADWEDIEADKKILVFQGHFRLVDAFGIRTRFKFCHLWNPIRQGWSMAILDEYNEEIEDLPRVSEN